MLVLIPDLFESVVDTLIDDLVFFDPADLTSLRFHLQEPFAVLQHLEALPVGDLSDPVADDRDAVAQRHVLRQDIDVFVMNARLEVTATGQQNER